MIIDDVVLGKNVDPRIKRLLDQIVQILNEGQYEQKTFANAPTTSSPGFEGETRNVITGSVFTQYKYASGSWWYSDATVSNGWSKLV